MNAAGLSALAACTTVTGKAPATKEATSLHLVDRTNAELLLKGHVHQIAASKDAQLADQQHSAMASECGVGVGQIVSLEGLPLLAVGVAIDLFLEEIRESIDRAIKEYSTLYGAGLTVPVFYDDPETPTIAMRCFVMRRGPNATEAAAQPSIDEPNFELVGQMLVQDDVLLVRPLRVYFGEAGAERKDADEWALTSKLTMVSIWRNEAMEGQEQTLFDGNFHKMKVTPETKGSVLYPAWNVKDGAFTAAIDDQNTVEMPLPSVSATEKKMQNDFTVRLSTVRISISVAEVGKNKSLEAMQKVFGKASGPLGKLLKDTAGELLD